MKKRAGLSGIRGSVCEGGKYQSSQYERLIGRFSVTAVIEQEQRL